MTSHIHFDADARRLLLLDQRLLPTREAIFVCCNYHDVIYAIKNMVVRGAPAIGIAAAWACLLAAQESKTDLDLEKALAEIAEARPTAVNLAWAVKRMRSTWARYGIDALAAEASAIQTEDIEICHRIGNVGKELIHDGDTVLTHCNAGALATGGYGTALGIIRAAHEQGKRVKVIADETRPLLQGSRLTAYELKHENIPVTIACDNAAAWLMAQNQVSIVLTGADRIALNGDAANKIGTLGLAILARHYKLPFYIAAPLSTFDADAPSGAAIPIEKRESGEALCFANSSVAPEGVAAVNYAFDVTPADLISGFITEIGIISQPYQQTISQTLANAC